MRRYELTTSIAKCVVVAILKSDEGLHGSAVKLRQAAIVAFSGCGVLP
jgi:hypothetical protein